VLTVDLNNAVPSQIKNFDQLTSQKVDATAYWPLASGALNAAVARAKAANIPVFGKDAFTVDKAGSVSLKGVDVTATVNEGRTLVAEQAADMVCKRLADQPGDVLYGDYGNPAPSTLVLKFAFEKALEACSGGKLKVAQVFLNKTDDVAGAQGTAAAALQKYPNTKAIVNYNDETAQGASLAVKRLGRDPKDILITGYNLAPPGIRYLTAGNFNVSWDARSTASGQRLARLMVDYLAGTEKSPPKVTTVYPQCFTKATIGDLPSFAERLKSVAAGEDLVDAEPELVSETAEIPASAPANAPTCDVD
jgi:ABC-type sugar transport system substrate-binding protein